MKLSEIIDIEKIEDDLRGAIIEYSSIPQLIIGQQDKIPEDMLTYPRGVLKITPPYDEDGVQAITQKKIDSSSESFEHDIQRTHHLFPKLTITFDGYGNPKEEDIGFYFQKISNWFKVRDLGQEWFDNYDCDIVIREVNPVSDITVEFQDEYEKRLNLDIIVEVKQEIETVHNTVEIVEVLHK